MRLARWISALSALASLAACAVSVPDLTVGSSGTGGAAGGGPGTGGAVDCTATSDCSSNGCACEPDAPDGFQGPVLFARVAEIACPAGFPMKTALKGAFEAVTAAKADCKPCACGTEPCGTATIKAYSDSNCSTAPATVTEAPEGCAMSFGFPIHSVKVSDASTSQNACSHSGGGVKSLPAPVPEDVVTVCSGQVGAGCGQSAVCIPAPAGPFEACVYTAGNATCPNGFSKKHVVYTDTIDSRTCTACDCAAPAPTCATTFEAFGSGDCTTASLGDGVSGMCFMAPPGKSGQSLTPHVASPCSPTGGEPTGDVAPSMPYTLCCN